MERKIYISLPITGRDEEVQRRLAGLWAKYFENRGYNVLNPFDVYDELIELWGRAPTYREIMHVDLMLLSDKCSDILLVGDWHNSNGCMEEVDTATAKGIKIWYDVKVKLNWE